MLVWTLLGLGLAAVAALIWVWRLRRRLAAAECLVAQLRAEGQASLQLDPAVDRLDLQTILDHLPQGVSVFDAKLRLRGWNRRLLDVLELPAEVVYDGVAFEDLLMVPARRGEYGPGDPAEQVAQRKALALKFLPHRFERTRPSGLTHLVEGRPIVRDGRTIGFVASYTDISDRTRAEQALKSRHDMLRTLVDNIPSGITVFDAGLRLALHNRQAAELLDLPQALLASEPGFDELVRFNAERGEYGEVDPAAKVREMAALVQQPVRHVMERTRPDGRVLDIRGAPLPEGGFVSVYTDITERKLVERELRTRNAVFRKLIDNIPGGVSLFDAQLQLVAANEAFQRLLGFPDWLMARDPVTLESLFRFNAERGEYGDGDIEAKVAELLERAGRREAHVFERARPDGTVLEIRGLPLPDGGFVTIYTDVTEHRRALEAVERLAHRDALTGLDNRYTLEARLDQAIADAKRRGHQLAVVFIDMDHFKGVNDSLGHAAGDEFLKTMATRLRAKTRESDIVARLGGDEFVVVLSNIDTPGASVGVVIGLQERLGEAVVLGGQQLTPSASMGIALFPQDGEDRAALMKHADVAMYAAKNAGRAGYRFFEAAMTGAAAERLHLESDLRQALRRREFELHYQPKVNARGEALAGFEALIRWRRAGGELVLPGRFIGLAEETGLIGPIGEWALNEACATLQRWRALGLVELTVSVNLSARQLRDPGLAGVVRQALDQHRIPPSCLELEITESVAMEDPQRTVTVLQALKAIGVSLSIDDFGTGYSSLAYLKLLPIDHLKLDRAFVTDLETDPNDAAICAATIGLAHTLGLRVVAEGVETDAQADYLRGLACDLMQGFRFGRPMPEAQARARAFESAGHGVAALL